MSVSKLLRLLTFLLCCAFVSPTETVYAETKDSPSFFDLKGVSIVGKPVNFSQFKGKVVLVVNTASQCGFTPQFHDLQELYENYASKGLEILGFPSNDFGNQDPGTNEEIKKFCKLNFGVTFPLFQRNPVSGDDIQPTFKFLTQQSGKDFKGEISWNFEKFLIGRDGQVKARFGSYVNPLSPRIKDKIEELLGDKE